MMPRTLVFKIRPDRLIWENWIEWCTFAEEEFHNIMDIRNKNKITTGNTDREFDLVGRYEDVFHFLHDLAFRYDIEII